MYLSHANDLIANGHAYRCFCSKERLDLMAKHRIQAGLSSGYDRKCAHLSAEESEDRAAKGETHIIRLKLDEYDKFTDLVYGEISQDKRNKKLDLIDRVYDDPVLIKSDGHPTYHLANVVDDHCMKITHVLRGEVSCLDARKIYSTYLLLTRNGWDLHHCIWPCIMPSNGRLPSSATSPCSLARIDRSSANEMPTSTFHPSGTNKAYLPPRW